MTVSATHLRVLSLLEGLALLGCQPIQMVAGDGTVGGSMAGADATTEGDSSTSEDPPLGDPPGDRPPSRPDIDAVRPCFDPGLYAYVDGEGSCDGRRPCFVDPQQAIEAAEFGTTIWVNEGTYEPVPGQEHVVDSTSVLVCLRSVDGPASTIFDGKGSGTVVYGGYEGAVWIEGFTIRGAGPGGGSQTLDG